MLSSQSGRTEVERVARALDMNAAPNQESESASLARKPILEVADVLRLLRYEGRELVIGHDDGFLVVLREGIRLSPQLTDDDAMRLLFSKEQALILELEQQVRLDFPCTPEGLLDWFNRINESSPVLSEQGVLTEETIDLLELPLEFIEALTPQARKRKGGRPTIITPELREKIERAISSLPPNIVERGGGWIVQCSTFTQQVFGKHERCSANQYHRVYGIGHRTIADFVRKIVKQLKP